MVKIRRGPSLRRARLLPLALIAIPATAMAGSSSCVEGDDGATSPRGRVECPRIRDGRVHGGMEHLWDLRRWTPTTDTNNEPSHFESYRDVDSWNLLVYVFFQRIAITLII